MPRPRFKGLSVRNDGTCAVCDLDGNNITEYATERDAYIALINELFDRLEKANALYPA